MRCSMKNTKRKGKREKKNSNLIILVTFVTLQHPNGLSSIIMRYMKERKSKFWKMLRIKHTCCITSTKNPVRLFFATRTIYLFVLLQMLSRVSKRERRVSILAVKYINFPEHNVLMVLLFSPIPII